MEPKLFRIDGGPTITNSISTDLRFLFKLFMHMHGKLSVTLGIVVCQSIEKYSKMFKLDVLLTVMYVITKLYHMLKSRARWEVQKKQQYPPPPDTHTHIPGSAPDGPSYPGIIKDPGFPQCIYVNDRNKQ